MVGNPSMLKPERPDEPSAIPPELGAFLRLPGPQSLLVKGPAGSGKTSLCLSLLRNFPGFRMLVTTRVGASEILREFPWTASTDPHPIEVVDISVYLDSVTQREKVAADAQQFMLPARRSLPPPGEEVWLPAPLEKALTGRTKDGPGLLVVDSWDGLVEAYLGAEREGRTGTPDRPEVERLLWHRLSQTPLHLIFVEERVDEGQMDFLCNGVVWLDRKVRDDRLERWLSLPKLRGIRTQNVSYPFTLEHGEFTAVLPLRGNFLQGTHTSPEDPPDGPRGLWPGCVDFAEGFGWIPSGRLVVLEVDPQVPEVAETVLWVPMVLETLRRGGRAVVVPTPAFDAELVWAALERNLPDPHSLVNLRLLVASDGPGHLQGMTWLADHMKIGSSGPRFVEAHAFLRDGSSVSRPRLFFVSGDGLQHAAARHGFNYDDRNGIASLQSYLQIPGIHLVVSNFTNDPNLQPLTRISRMHLRLASKGGKVFLQGIRPHTPNYILADGDTQAPYHLLRVA